jgi:hypothetical protein
MDEIKSGYYVSRKCAACIAVDKAGNPLRDWLDHEKDKGATTNEVIKKVFKQGVILHQPNLDTHFRVHSPWIRTKKRNLATAKINNAISRETLKHREAEEEIQKLVNVGGDRVDKGEIPVDKELYMFALDRKTRNPTPVSIQNLVMNFGDALVESHKKKKVIEGETVGTTK